MNLESIAQMHTKMDNDLFDITKGYDDETGVKFAPGLTEEEIQQAKMLYHLFNELWGVCVVKGDPGTGKDLFGNYLTWKIKRFFPHKRIMRDEKPYPLYGPYAGMFNEEVLQDNLRNMRAIAKGMKITEVDKVMDKAADEWVKGEGEVLLKNSVLYLTEYWRYCYNREAMNPMNKTMGAIHKTKRHLDCLIIGTTQLLSELDKKTSKPWIDWITTCTRSRVNKTGFTYFIQKVKYDRRTDKFAHIGSPNMIAFDAGKPRADLGDGNIIIKKYNYEPETEEERIVLEVLKSGVDTYEELINIIEKDGDMSEGEVLATLKDMKFRRSKRVVDYPCFFGLWNSKSAPQIKSTLRVEE